jgi:hypothetical protein
LAASYKDYPCPFIIADPAGEVKRLEKENRVTLKSRLSSSFLFFGRLSLLSGRQQVVKAENDASTLAGDRGSGAFGLRRATASRRPRTLSDAVISRDGGSGGHRLG